MDSEMEGIFERAGELTQDLMREYQKSAQRGEVSERAKNLFHEVLIKVRSALDFAMNRVFNKHTILTGKKKNRMEKKAGFPICRHHCHFNERMKSLGLSHLEQSNPRLYMKLQQSQPFSSGRRDLLWLQDLSNLGKHARLALQDCQLHEAKKVTGPNGTVAIFTEGSGPVDGNGSPVDPAPHCGVQDIILATFEVHYESGTVTMPAISCRAFCQDARHYVGGLLTLL